MRDIPRTVAAISSTTDLARLLRDGIPMPSAQVRPVGTAAAVADLTELEEAVWALVTDTPDAVSAIAGFCRRRAALVFWLGPEPPKGLPRHTTVCVTWRILVERVNLALQKEVAGMRLARQYGVDLPGGDFTDSTALEVLIGAYPAVVEVEWAATTHLNRLLERHDVGCRVDRLDGACALVEATP